MNENLVLARTIPNTTGAAVVEFPRYRRPWRLISLNLVATFSGAAGAIRLQVLDGEGVAIFTAQTKAALSPVGAANIITFGIGLDDTPRSIANSFDAAGAFVTTMTNDVAVASAALIDFPIQPQFRVQLSMPGGGASDTMTAIRYSFDFPSGVPVGIIDWSDWEWAEVEDE